MITPLLDARGSFATFAEGFPAADEARVSARFPELFDGPKWQTPIRAFLVGPSVLVDTGVGRPSSWLPGAQGWLPGELDRNAVEVVILTHLHADHIGWTVDADGAPFFPRARYVVSADDWRWAEPLELFQPKLAPLRDAGVVDLVALEEAEVAPGVTLIPTPGHTPGHLCVRAGDTVIIGDLAVHPAQVDDPDLVFMLDVDPARAARARRTMLDELASSGAVAAACHFPEAFGRIERAGAGFEWRPLSSEA